MLSAASHEPLAVEINLQFVGLGSVSREASPRLASPPLGHGSRALVGGREGGRESGEKALISQVSFLSKSPELD